MEVRLDRECGGAVRSSMWARCGGSLRTRKRAAVAVALRPGSTGAPAPWDGRGGRRRGRGPGRWAALEGAAEEGRRRSAMSVRGRGGDTSRSSSMSGSTSCRQRRCALRPLERLEHARDAHGGELLLQQIPSESFRPAVGEHDPHSEPDQHARLDAPVKSGSTRCAWSSLSPEMIQMDMRTTTVARCVLLLEM